MVSPHGSDSAGDDNINNGADSRLKQLHVAIVRISMVISVLKKLTVETPDQPGWMCLSPFSWLIPITKSPSPCCEEHLSRYGSKPRMENWNSGAPRTDTMPGKAKTLNQWKIKEDGSAKGKGVRCELDFFRMGIRPAEVGEEPASNSSCGLSFTSYGGASTPHRAFNLWLSCFQSGGTINYCQQ